MSTEPAEILVSNLGVLDKILLNNNFRTDRFHMGSAIEVHSVFEEYKDRFALPVQKALSIIHKDYKTGDQWADPNATRCMYLGFRLHEAQIAKALEHLAAFLYNLNDNGWLNGALAPLSLLKLNTPILDRQTGHFEVQDGMNIACVCCGEKYSPFSFFNSTDVKPKCTKLGQNVPEQELALFSFVHVPTRLHEAIRDVSSGLAQPEGGVGITVDAYNPPIYPQFKALVNFYNARYI